MDSCHIFNFLFGTKRATTELSKCFSSIGDKVKKSSHASSSKEYQAPSSPLKQLQMKIVNLATNSNRAKKESKDNSTCQDRTYRATLVQAAEVDEESVGVDDEGQYNIEENCSSAKGEKDMIERSSVVSMTLGQQCKTSLLVEPMKSTNGVKEQFPESVSKKQTVAKCKRVVMYGDCDPRQSEDSKRILASAEVYSIVSEFGEARAKLRRISSVSNKQEVPRIDEQTVQNEPDDLDAERSQLKSFELAEEMRDKRSVYVRTLVKSIESNNSFDEANSVRDCRPAAEKPTGGHTKPMTFVKPLPPKTAPKSIRARCLNLQLSLNKPVKIQQLFLDEQFLTRFFDKLEPLDRCVAAQVCRSWRNILYANHNYWKDLINVIDCTQLRREHLVECIINTLQSAKLKQQRTIELKEVSQQRSAGKTPRTNSRSDQFQAIQQPIIYGSNTNRHQQLEYNSLENNNNQVNDRKQCSVESLFDFDQDDVWRIQELCNRFTQRAGHTFKPHNTDTNNNGSQQANEYQACMTSKSSSIPSQISSTLSSFSISSLLSPLSESSRIESIKEKLYTSLDDRGFDAICLFGATDDDIEDLVSKTPAGAHKRILVGRLNNCCLTNRGLELFLSTFDQIREIELSGCNEITNSFELAMLDNLQRLTITDCINIADGFAQKLVQVLGQLDSLTIQAYHLTDAFLDYLSMNSDTTRLVRLELPNCKEVTNQSLLTIAKHFTQLEALSISGSTKISDEGIEILTEHAKHLKSLDLSWCSRITDAALECIACDLGETLNDLILDRNVHITDSGLGYLATMSKLTLLHIRWCSRITDVGLESVLSLATIRYLSLAGLHQITVRSLLCLVDSDLLEVELTNCKAVNNDLLIFLSEKLPKCNIIF